MKNKLIFGYDILTYNGELPNCLNPKYINTVHTASDFDYSKCMEKLVKRIFKFILHHKNPILKC